MPTHVLPGEQVSCKRVLPAGYRRESHVLLHTCPPAPAVIKMPILHCTLRVCVTPCYTFSSLFGNAFLIILEFRCRYNTKKKIGWERNKKCEALFLLSRSLLLFSPSQPSSFFFLSGLRGFWLSQDMTPDSFKNREWKQYGYNDLIASHTALNLIYYWWCSH